MKKLIILAFVCASFASAGVVRFCAKQAVHAPKHVAKAAKKTVRVAVKVLF
jgi:hypothetical protein